MKRSLEAQLRAFNSTSVETVLRPTFRTHWLQVGEILEASGTPGEGGAPAAVVLRRGPALRLALRDGKSFLVTVDDPATGAALLSDLIAAGQAS